MKKERSLRRDLEDGEGERMMKNAPWAQKIRSDPEWDTVRRMQSEEKCGSFRMAFRQQRIRGIMWKPLCFSMKRPMRMRKQIRRMAPRAERQAGD